MKKSEDHSETYILLFVPILLKVFYIVPYRLLVRFIDQYNRAFMQAG